jgi:hypothetical protein
MKVSIYKEPWDDYINIMFWDAHEGKCDTAKQVELRFIVTQEGRIEKPVLRVSGLVRQRFLEALAEAIDFDGVIEKHSCKARAEAYEDAARIVSEVILKTQEFPDRPVFVRIINAIKIRKEEVCK